MRLPSLPLSTLLLAAGLAPAAALAQQGVNLSVGPVDYTTWSRFGSAQAQNSTPGNGYTYSVLELTQPGSGDQAGAAFAPAALALDFNQAFRFDFNWYIQSADPGDLRGDGLTFALTTAPALGGGGSDLGYAGLPSSSVAMAAFRPLRVSSSGALALVSPASTRFVRPRCFCTSTTMGSRSSCTARPVNSLWACRRCSMPACSAIDISAAKLADARHAFMLELSDALRGRDTDAGHDQGRHRSHRRRSGLLAAERLRGGAGQRVEPQDDDQVAVTADTRASRPAPPSDESAWGAAGRSPRRSLTTRSAGSV